MAELVLALAAFVGTHLLLSHPARAPLVRRLGERGFALLYSVVALATLFWAVSAFERAPTELWWIAPAWLWWVAAAIMLVASVLLVGSVTTPNPAMMGMGGMAGAAMPRGVQRITRHPMMWSFALWAVAHAAVAGHAAAIWLALAIGSLALVGSRLQDGKKREQLGGGWESHAARTSYVPFGRQLSGRARWATAFPGWIALGGGLALFAVATWAHPLLGAPGIWERLG